MSNSLWPHGLYSPWNSPGQNTGVGSLSLLQGIFPIQGSSPGLPHCKQILHQLSYQESPYRELGPHLFSGFHSHWIISTKVLPACGCLVLPALNSTLTQINPTSSLSLWIPKFELLSFGDKVLVHLTWGSPVLAIFPSLWLKKKFFFIILPLSLSAGHIEAICKCLMTSLSLVLYGNRFSMNIWFETWMVLLPNDELWLWDGDDHC